MHDQDIPEAPWPEALAAWRAVMWADTWFAGIPPSLRQALLQLGRVQSLGPGRALFGRGQAAEGLCCVLEGALRVGAVQADGSESVLAFVEPGQWFGEISLIDGQPRTHDATADGPTTVLQVPQAALLGWLAKYPAHWQAIAQLACAKLRMLFGVIEDIAHRPLEARLAKRLWLVAHGYGGRTSAPRTTLRLPQEQLALMLGVSRQSANKALRALEARGVIALRYGGIDLLDLAALAVLGGGLGFIGTVPAAREADTT
ncbi:MAG TPA: Crp/Fnr family transcriptional regulator [Ideonella sp.]|uniref:Crp/Fnr family transcriptional regulator n=1 Tax=Ideonella sp. TaxID=1929293 RepID=UPI002E312E51|nr:Crp/Fnr family transcriptional regulator [Ideonella sp.]HEX5684087.1 Crp/Fnr family transcriptional regulator [Ideonella sp.]